MKLNSVKLAPIDQYLRDRMHRIMSQSTEVRVYWKLYAKLRTDLGNLLNDEKQLKIIRKMFVKISESRV